MIIIIIIITLFDLTYYTCGGRQAWSKALGLEPSPSGVRGFKSHPPHHVRRYPP